MTRWTLVSGDFVTTGGMDRANHALAAYLADTGESVELVTHRAAPDLTARAGIRVRLVPKPFGSYFLGRGPLNWIGRRAGRATRAAGGRVLVNGANCRFPDVNWVHFIHAAHTPQQPASSLRRFKSRIERPLELRAERLAIGTARVVVCNSERTRRDVIEKLGVAPERAITVYYGTDPDEFHPATPDARAALRTRLGWSETQPMVVFIGALGDRRKGFDTLFAAWQALCREPSWDGVLAVVGRGAELPVWEERAAAAKLADRIRFLGFRTDVPDLLRAADALVHPARYEAYGLGVHESLCCGLPAIVSRDAGVAERYPADLGELLLADPDSVTELAARLRHWRENRESLAARVRPLADELRSRTWADMARDLRATVLAAP